MESKANFILIGVFVLVAIFGAVGFIAYISGRQFDQTYDEYLVEYHTPPRGISVGSEVRYNGLIMGEVTETALDPKNPSNVLVHIRVKSSTPVLKDTYAQNEPLGLTGLSYIQLFAGASAEPIVIPEGKELARIEGRGSQIDSLLGGSESVIDNVNQALTRAISVLGPEATEDFHGILANINTITGAIANSDLSEERLRSFLNTYEQTGRDISKAAKAFELTAQDISTLVKSDEVTVLLVEAEQTMKKAQATLDAYIILAESGGELSEELRRTIEQFSAAGLQDLNTVIADLRKLTSTLNEVGEDLKTNPVGFLAGQERETMELPQ
jgi:phospholipid/cholesterol/gamma-HCH transport system substrate-binding protein